ncbi:hypothetical protein WN51_13655 [Melipona quadrifasciata]|uniref:Uncharacterized protein n=1 Tax=Melipona quadrifasciata TaxID=166423 RepID=A0A0N0U4V6_9HYME|nr:hypothetical protein WN51_13655 [Melipona quadrifasciata]
MDDSSVEHRLDLNYIWKTRQSELANNSGYRGQVATTSGNNTLASISEFTRESSVEKSAMAQQRLNANYKSAV